MSENVEQVSVEQAAAAKVLRVPNIVNLVAAVVAAALLAVCLFMPLLRVGAPEEEQYEGFQGVNEVQLSAFDVLTGLSGGDELGTIREDMGNLDKAINLLYLQSMADYQAELKDFEAAGSPEGQEPTVPHTGKFMIMFSNISMLLLPLMLLISAIMCLIKLIQAVIRMFAPKTYPKSAGNGELIWVIPVAVVAVDLLFGLVGPMIDKKMAYEYAYYGYEMTNLIIVFVTGLALTVTDIVVSAMAKKISRKHYPQ